MKTILRAALKPFPRLKQGLRAIALRFNYINSVSTDYSAIDLDHLYQEAQRLRSSWKHDGLPERQRSLVDRQLEEYRKGLSIDVFDVFVLALQQTGLKNGSLLEVGCSSGYYAEVMSIKALPYSYTGCDYSSAFIELARKRYPNLAFVVGDTTQLAYADDTFDVVVSGCCILHVPEFDKAIAETARVARHWVIFHRTPVVTGMSNQYYRKRAYGVETIEIHFNEDELLRRFARHGLELVQNFTLGESSGATQDASSRHVRTYLCRKTSRA